MIETYASCFAILMYKNKLLLILRDDNPQLEVTNVWGFIGGKIKSSESAEEACKREILTSSGLVIKNCEKLTVLENKNEKHVGFLCSISDSDVNHMKPESDRQKLGFFTLPDMQKIRLSELPTLFLSQHQSVFQRLNI